MKNEHGFTAIELLITLIIGTLMLVSAYQIYSFVLNDSKDTRTRTSASNLAYRFMRENAARATKPCSAITISPAPTIPASSNLPSGSTASVVISCPNTVVPNMSQITSTVTYGGKSITHATYVSAP